MKRFLTAGVLGAFLAGNLMAGAFAEMVSLPNNPTKCPSCKVKYDRYGFVTRIIDPVRGEWELKPKMRLMVDYQMVTVSEEYKYGGPPNAFQPIEPPKKKVKKVKDKKKDKDHVQATSDSDSCGVTPTAESCDK